VLPRHESLTFDLQNQEQGGKCRNGKAKCPDGAHGELELYCADTGEYSASSVPRRVLILGQFPAFSVRRMK